MTPQPSATQRDLISLGKIAEEHFGLTVGENPWFGGVNPVHVKDSYHYRGLAIDVSGDPKKMLAFDRYVAKRYGPILAELFHEPGVNLKNGQATSPIGGHEDHVHVALDPSLLHGHQSAYFGPKFNTGLGGSRKRGEEIIAGENLKSGPLDVIPGGHAVADAAGGVAEEVASGIAGMLADHAGAFMLNVALVGGGAFLVYYGAALMLGVKQPAKPIVQAAAGAAAIAPK